MKRHASILNGNISGKYFKGK